MDEHLVFFIDFLGFKNAVSTWEKGKMQSLITLVRNIRAQQTNFERRELTVEEGGNATGVNPAITAFSDSVVVSYPIKDLEKLSPRVDLISGLFLGLKMTQQWIGSLAVAAMKLGFLIRGGAAVGPLYHSEGVVLGQAMNEAYLLEHCVSIYPRIAVSRKIYTVVGSPDVMEDHDGIRHFDYLRSMILRSSDQEDGDLPGAGVQERRKIWLVQTRMRIDENIAQFDQKGQWKELAKWTWFRNSLEETAKEHQ